jgi:hypothetical protein
MRNFKVYRDGNRYMIKSEHWDEFIAYAEPADDAMAAERICDAMNLGFDVGYSIGEADAQAAMRRALGME